MEDKEGKSRGFFIVSAQDILHINVPKPRGGKILFRGQDVDLPLLPKIARVAQELKISDPVKEEQQLMENFRRLSIPYLLPPYPESEWEWLAIARHYGLPTRLLDWTTNAFVALWFAVNKEPESNDGHGVLWVLKTTPQDIKPINIQSPFSIKKTLLFQPAHINRRISAQSGWFSAHKYIEEKKTFVPLEKNRDFKVKLTKHLIPYEHFPRIKYELEQMGLNIFSMYQDLGSLCQQLTDEFYADQE